jgi:Domain of unknown function (DUF4129)
MPSRQPGHEPPRGLWSAGWPVRVVPSALLLILALAGLRGSIAKPRWTGPMHTEAAGVGGALIVVLIILWVITWLRRGRALAQAEADADADLAAKLRGVLLAVLSLGIATVAVVLIYAAHLNWFNGKPTRSSQSVPPPSRPSPPHPARGGSGILSIPLGDILYGLLVLALMSAVVLSIWWSRRLRRPLGPADEFEGTEDSEDLREAVESGRSAMRALDDARAAIIACYVAMERSLAERGAARGVAGTPDELLARATSGDIVRGTAPARLTVLFYEARFSSHPMDQTQRRAAEQALDELAAALAARPEPAEAST